jgi:GT2 family glycosyltransferase
MAIAGLHGEIQTIRAEKNGGFAAGANYGIRAALAGGADYVWLLNNDTLVEPDCLGSLVASMEGSPEFGVASPVILGSESTHWSSEIWFAGGTVSLARGIASHLTATPSGVTLVQTEYVSGCTMLLRRGVIERVGMMDESFFLFWEDVEYCLRIRRNGWLCGVLPTARVLHKVHGTVGYRSYDELSIRNGRAVAGRYGSSLEIVGILSRSALGIGHALLGLASSKRGRAASMERLRGHAAGTGRLLNEVAKRLARRKANLAERSAGGQ